VDLEPWIGVDVRCLLGRPMRTLVYVPRLSRRGGCRFICHRAMTSSRQHCDCPTRPPVRSAHSCCTRDHTGTQRLGSIAGSHNLSAWIHDPSGNKVLSSTPIQVHISSAGPFVWEPQKARSPPETRPGGAHDPNRSDSLTTAALLNVCAAPLGSVRRVGEAGPRAAGVGLRSRLERGPRGLRGQQSATVPRGKR
jgi:hypothetical protein